MTRVVVLQPARPYPPTLPSRKGVLYCSACTVCILRAANPRVCISSQSLGSSHTSGCVTKAPVDRSRQDFKNRICLFRVVYFPVAVDPQLSTNYDSKVVH